jgi:hypothetical protein
MLKKKELLQKIPYFPSCTQQFFEKNYLIYFKF